MPVLPDVLTMAVYPRPKTTSRVGRRGAASGSDEIPAVTTSPPPRDRLFSLPPGDVRQRRWSASSTRAQRPNVTPREPGMPADLADRTDFINADLGFIAAL